MRVLVAPDAFAGAMSAVEAAHAIREGWLRRAPDDEVDLAPMSDGGPGLVDVLQATLGGELLARTVRGPFGEAVPASLLVVDDGDRRTAYVEAAQAGGLHLSRGERGEQASSYGVGELLAAAVDAVGETGRVVVGLGALGTNDGGAGLLAALGATADRPLDAGAAGLEGVTEVNLGPARARVGGVGVRGACEDASLLSGLFGTTKAAGGERGITEERLPGVDAVLESWGAATGRRVALEERTGAGGGCGHALRLLGADLHDGLRTVAEALDLPARSAAAEVVLTGEASLDFSGRSGRVPGAVARVAADAMRPCVVLAGRVVLGRRELRTQGIEAAYGVADLVDPQRAATDPGGALADLAARVARTWSM
ncbi:glycerate kinase [Nocardioides sp. CFH 31398]|uniref:glycerate kinase n=1 Tax=Nocardioides sp. CFH 31398 TaxID=2919579 RepID=UPI001F051C0B|nr:glycerate kinase [Nocardioides sp. CFH 31398]MCH1868192.1 glycerate kinase [Nocardioides sp. CFH 31398]